ncbi:radical SAM protein [Myxococcota bacterium]|nr:radical SAM protein [Myxococcota bacterium]MBU1381679.1 radical SAM protein [Myxococcota bacterium]MBU1496809.1 radical SAM protein [Myxococcota bacterium]
MFKSLRIQVIQPCRARCKWCGTYKKNGLFQKLIDQGTAKKVHDFYLEAVERFKPESLYISGGEPILMEGIGKYLAELGKHVERRIFLFTSFQYSAQTRENLDLEGTPWDKVILTHTTAGFDREIWDDMTQGFPFDLYIDNIRKLSALPWRKHVKFIINHDNLQKELEDFAELIKPDKTFHLSLKLMNNQAGNFGAGEIKKTRENVLKLIKDGIAGLPEGLDIETNLTGEDAIAGFMKGDGGESCPYRKEPLELRFAFHKGNDKSAKLQYRFCPHFPPSKHYIFKTGRENIDDITLAYNTGKWHSWCSKCRLRLYVKNSGASSDE